jgi:hypothetical protein
MIANILHTIILICLYLLGTYIRDAFAVSTALSTQVPKSLIFVFPLAASSLMVFKDLSSFTSAEWQQNSEVTFPHSSDLIRLNCGSILNPGPDTNCSVTSIDSLSVSSPTQPLVLDTKSKQHVISFVHCSDTTASLKVEVSPPAAQVEMRH